MIREDPIKGARYISFDVPPATPYDIERIYASLKDRELELLESVCRTLPSAERCARENASAYRLPDKVFEVARTFTPQELPGPVTYFPDFWRCYSNSFKYAEETGCMYVEGVAVNPSGPLLHAWNSMDGNDVIDYTWPYQHLNRYYGVVLDTGKLRAAGYPQGAVLGLNAATFGRKPIAVDIRTLVVP